MMLQHRQIDELVDVARHHLGHIGPAEMRIVRVLTGFDQRHFHELVRVIAAHIELRLTVRFRRRRPAHALRNPFVDSRRQKLILISIEHDYVARADSGLGQPVENLPQHDRVGAERRAAHGTYFNANHVALFEQCPPRVGPGRGAREGRHPARHHLFHRVGLVETMFDRMGVLDGDHAPRPRSGHAIFRCGTNALPRVQRGSQHRCKSIPKKFASRAYHAAIVRHAPIYY